MTRKEKAVEWLFNRCNKIGDNAMANVELEKYKIFADEPDPVKDALTNYTHERLGFGTNLLTNDEMELLITKGYIKSELGK